jgi:SAM-dependent methyltransferase
MLSKQSASQDVLICGNAECDYSRSGFPVLDGVPVLVDFDASVLSKAAVVATHASSTKERDQSGLVKRVINTLLRSDGPTPENAAAFLHETTKVSERPVVLVIGGGTIGTGAHALYETPQAVIISTDIYRSDLTDIVADGHRLPLADGSVHAVWIQAVLEHVLEPHVVAAEIHRVLVPGGVVYAETPFMQQVHEGAYDFSRFTLSGHRWLFRDFEEIGSGIVRGPGTVMLWSIRYFVGALFGSWKVGTLASLPFFWLRYLDAFAKPKFAADGPSGVFFLGRRSDNALRPAEIISFYKGAQ